MRELVAHPVRTAAPRALRPNPLAAALVLALAAGGAAQPPAAPQAGGRTLSVVVTDTAGRPLAMRLEATLEDGTFFQVQADGEACHIPLGSSRGVQTLRVRANGHQWDLKDLPANQAVRIIHPSAAAAPAPAAAAREPRVAGFEEVGAAAGVATPNDTSGVLWEDFDGDGDLDLLSVGGHRDSVIGPPFPDTLFRNEGDGTFVDTTAEAGLADLAQARGAAVGDYDNDGDADVYIANGDGTGEPEASNLYRNDGTGHFEDVAREAGVAVPWTNGHGAEFFDMDRDGDLDLYVVNMNHDSNMLFRNRGRGRFFDATEAAGGVSGGGFGRDVAILDYNRDGWPDIYVVNAQDPNRLYRNNRDGSFTDVAAAAGVDLALTGRSVAAVDYNDDGWFDLYVINSPSFEPNALFRNNGDGSFTDVAVEAGVDQTGFQVFSFGTAFGDANADGRQDLFISQRDTFYTQLPDATFIDVTALSGVEPDSWGQGAAFADYDADGRLDFYLGRSDATATDRPNALFHNVASAGGWLAVKLRGVVSNRSAIGTEIELTTRRRTQFRMLTGGDAHGSANPRVAWFGLGAGDSPRRLLVRWPSGLVQERSLAAEDTGPVELTETGIQVLPPGQEGFGYKLRIAGPPGHQVAILRSRRTGFYDGPPFGGAPYDGALFLDPAGAAVLATLTLDADGTAVLFLPLSLGTGRSGDERYYQALVGPDLAGGDGGMTNLVTLDPFPGR